MKLIAMKQLMDSTRILVCSPYFPPHIGGIEQLAYNVSRFCRQAGMDIRICSNYTSEKELVGYIDGLHVSRAKCFTVYTRPVSMQFYFMVHKELKEFDPHIVHLYTPLTIDYLIARNTKKAGKKVVITYAMDPIIDGAETFFKNFVQTIYHKFSIIPCLQSADLIISTTDHYIRLSPLLSKFSHKCVTIPQGVDLDKFRPPVKSEEFEAIEIFKRKYDLLNGENVVLFVGRLVPYKGVQVLIKSYGNDSRLRRQTKLLFVGDGPEKATLQKLVVSYGLEDCIRFLGKLPEDELVLSYWASDVVVNPSVSRLESVPLSCLEALACGKPVITTDVGGNKELFSYENPENVGRLIPPYDQGELANAIIGILNYKKVGIYTREYAKNFSWKEICKKYIQMYKNLIEE